MEIKDMKEKVSYHSFKHFLETFPKELLYHLQEGLWDHLTLYQMVHRPCVNDI